MEAGETILSRGLPKTGQVLSYDSADDGFYQAGWWQSLKIGNNKTRFIAKTIKGDDVVIDLATGLIWAADGNVKGCNSGGTLNWFNSLIYAEALDFAGFNDWRLPNINELHSIIDYALNNPAIAEPPFTNSKIGIYLSSSTIVDTIESCWLVNFASGTTISLGKTGSYYLRCVCGGL